MRKLIHAVSMKYDKFRAKVRLIHHADSMEIDARVPHIKILQENAKRVAGRGRIVGVPYWTDASILVNRGKIRAASSDPATLESHTAKMRTLRLVTLKSLLESMHERRVDIFLDVFEMCHKFDFRNRLPIDKLTIPLADLLATKLQVVEITEAFVDPA